MTDSIAYYDNNAHLFIDGTVNVDMSELYSRFLQHMPVGGHILDAGCGSGRDAKYFLDRGYQVTAIDGSKEMVSAAAKLTGLAVQLLRFDDIDHQQEFDGIWACASVLHVEKCKMSEIIDNLGATLKDKGILYLSFKYGNSEEVRKGRHFSNYTEESFTQLLTDCNPLHLLGIWTTADARPDRQDELWLNGLLQK